MADLIISYLIKSQHGNPHGQRIDADGNTEDYRVSKKVKAADGTYKDERVTPGWYPVVTLSPEQVDAVQQAVEASGIRDMPAEITGDTSRSTANREAEWQVTTGGSIKTIQVTPWPPGGDSGQALFELSTQLSDIVNKALSG
ncbi:MAG: hypothetical protein CL610_12125 [Anaerolineaceae bacterium]|nr:hypothetical protein [Anaerolineaceae bacterium]